ncbi:MAG: hypothetical protein HY926_01150 [Elusimicrobia bacterium]|nr:hypothetical protein [Elusimicrobiota bacterium]
MRAALLALSLSLTASLPASAQFKLNLRSGTAAAPVVLPSLAVSPLHTSLQPAAAPSLSLQPSVMAAPAPMGAPSLEGWRSPLPEGTPTAVAALIDGKSLSAAIAPAAPAGEQAAALGKVFDGMATAPAFGGLGGGSVEMLNGAYGFYSWLSAQPEVAASPQAQANILLAALPALQKGPVIVMKDAAALTVLHADDASAPPIVMPLSGDALSKPSSPQAGILARRLEAAKAQDRAEGGVRMRVAELMAQLPAIALSVPAEEPARKKEASEPMPDPVRQPRAYMDRLLRDAARETDPFQTLKRLAFARAEARRRLNYQDGSRYLEQLLGAGHILARQFIPGLLEQAQRAAGGHDRALTDKLLKAALDFCEYAPGWKEKVLKAHEQARNTLEVLDRYGPVDEATGLPVPPPAEDGSAPAAP